MAKSKLSIWDSLGASRLQIVLLGGRNCGKNFLGNLILGKEEFVTKERTSSSRRLGAVSGLWLTVVDTPGWWCDSSAQDTSTLVKREIITSVSLCSPGPHAFLVTVKASSVFSERRRRAVEEHVTLLGEGAWGHCIVVFTFAYRFQHTHAEECVERGGEAVRWLAEKCGQRCHSVVLNDDADIAELLVKVQKLAAENGGRVFEMQENVLQKTAEEKRGAAERAQLRLLRMKRQRSLLREKLRPVTTIRLVLLGAKGSGKTSALNTILGRENSRRLSRTAQCSVGDAVVFGRQVTAVDTPGWWMNYFCNETPVFDRREMVLSLSLCPPGPHVFLLVVRVDRAFTETYRRAAQEHLELISEWIWARTILLFTFGDWLGDTTTEKFIESEGEPLRWLVEKCSNRYHVLNNKTKGDGFQVRELIRKIEEVMTCDGSWHYEIERRELEGMKRRMKEEGERATDRLRRKEKLRLEAKSEPKNPAPLRELRMILVGGRKGGKSSCGNTILNRHHFPTNTQTVSCCENQSRIEGKTVSVLDTPGCFPVTSEVLRTPSAILLVVNVSSSFTALHREAIEEQLDAGGSQLWSRTVVLFSHGDWLGDTSVEQRIESEGEPLRRLVERCGNRYHVLDNKNQGDAAQVTELIQLVEEMLTTERRADDYKDHRLWRRVGSAEEQQNNEMLRRRNLTKQMRRRDRLSLDSAESGSSSSRPEELNPTQVVALPARRAGRQSGCVFSERSSLVFLSVLKRSWSAIELPLRFPSPHSLSPRQQTMLLVSYQSPPSFPSEENLVGVHSLCHPALRERTLRRMCESGGLQALIDRWGHSSLEELESFIDSYFEMVWEQTMGSFQASESEPTATVEDAAVRDAGGEELLLSIDRKLTRLELLEEIRRDLAEVKRNLGCNT